MCELQTRKKQQDEWPNYYNDLYKRNRSDNALAKLNGYYGASFTNRN